SRYTTLIYSSAVVCFAATCLFAIAVLGWASMVLYERHNGFAQAVFAPPMRPEPREVERSVGPFPPWMEANVTRVDGRIAGGVVRLAGDEEELAEKRWEEERVSAIQDELDTRLSSLGLPPSTDLPCANINADETLFSRYSPLRGAGSAPSHARSGPTFFALNLYNSQHVLPSLSRTLLALSSFLGPETVHISIFENGSTDNTTVALAHLAAALSALGTPHTIVSDPRPTPWHKVDRIAQLSLYRNIALLPLEAAPLNSTAPPQDVVFINDVFVCPRDVLELLFQRRVQHADAACAMDWRENKGLAKRWNRSVKFYDNWVSRSLTGRMLRFKFDIFSDWRDGVKELFDQPGEEYSRARFGKGLAVPVYSCWNGVLALSAAPFLSSSVSPRYQQSTLPLSSGVEDENWQRTSPVRAGSGPVRFRSALSAQGECSASECKTLARDFWTRGFDRWMIIPTVRVTYDLAAYLHPQLVALSSLSPPSLSTLSLSNSISRSPDPPSSSEATPFSPPSSPSESEELIPWRTLTPPSSVLCFPWARGWHIDLEWWRATWERPFEGLWALRKRVVVARL
ncbi:hypothetical protein JCM6882_000101, partial [Rhodosporidiobolus microsporus]